MMTYFDKWKLAKLDIKKAQNDLIALQSTADELKDKAIAEQEQILKQLKGESSESKTDITPELEEQSRNIPAVAADFDINHKPVPRKNTNAKRSFTVSPGQKFNNWTVLRAAADHKKDYMYLCRCVCGHERFVVKHSLGKTTGCGCTVRKNSKLIPAVKNEKVSPVKKREPFIPQQAKINPPAKKLSASQQAAARARIEDLKEQKRLDKELSDYD